MIAGARARRAVSYAWWWWCASACAVAGWAIAAAPVAAQSERVQVAYAASDAEADDLAQTLRSALELPDLASDVRRVTAVDPRALIIAQPEAERPLARIWVDFTRGTQAFVYVVDRSWTRTYVRSIPRTDNAPLDHAQLGEIVRSAVQALQEGAVIGIAIERPPPVARAQPPPAIIAVPVTARSAVIAGGVSYAVGLRASGELVQGPGLYGYMLSRLGGIGLGGLLSIAYQPHRVTGQGAEARLDTLLLRAGPLIELSHGEGVAPRFMLGGGADIVHLAPVARADDVAPNAARTLAYPMLALSAGLRAPLTRDLELLVALTLDFDLVDTRFVRDLRDGARVVEDPYRVRPALSLSLGFY